MKTIFSFLLICTMLGCSTPASRETISLQDTVDTDFVSSGSVTVTVPETQRIVISDSSFNALNDLVKVQFEKWYMAIADSTKYYKVLMIDYYDEYEGQAELEQSTWYFNQEFSVVYFKGTFQDGGMQMPDVKEYIINDNSIICAKEDTYFSGTMNGRSLSLWDVQRGGIQFNLSTYDNKVISQTVMPADYPIKNQEEWDPNFLALKSTLEKGEVSDNGDIYTILIEVPKQSELMDYVKVIIPKQVYDRLQE